MFEEMIETTIEINHCENCETDTWHTLVEFVVIDMHGELIEVIDSWWQCQRCDQTTANLAAPDDFPF